MTSITSPRPTAKQPWPHDSGNAQLCAANCRTRLHTTSCRPDAPARRSNSRRPRAQAATADPADAGASTLLTMLCVAVSCLAIGYTGWWSRAATSYTTAQVAADNAALAAAWYANNTSVADPCAAADTLPKPATAQLADCTIAADGSATVTMTISPQGIAGMTPPIRRTARAGPVTNGHPELRESEP